MSRVILRVQDQLQRINLLSEEIDKIKLIETSILRNRPDEKTWSVIEVVEHMVLAHKPYQSKLDDTLHQLPTATQPIDEIKSKAIPSFLIKRFPPVKGKIKFKMKTMKQFTPLLSVESLDEGEINQIFDQFQNSLVHLNKVIKAYRGKKVKNIRFNSAIGASVKFNVAEACEFIICHNERHLHQIKNILKKVNN
ncbi:MAG: hypothetical protein R2780_01430 [Crocinitomicaceae bacterium]|nr:DinB family protein [Crocinitomicaceae bacterium]